uniref:non-specific serine/threonine protein kinase n=1 Tax=Oryza rufipogon TaxID=4529 RepID=A0A0E0RI59_ORYRU
MAERRADAMAGSHRRRVRRRGRLRPHPLLPSPIPAKTDGGGHDNDNRNIADGRGPESSLCGGDGGDRAGAVCELAIADANSTVVWSVLPAAETTGPRTARIRDDSNLVVTDARGRVAWQGFDHPTDTLLPNKNMMLTVWKSPSDPSPSSVVVAMDTSGDPEVFVWNGPNKRSRPWDGLQFTGVPDTVTYKNFSFTFVNSAREVTYSFQVPNASIMSRLVLNSSGAGVGGGLLQQWTWVEAAGAWNLYWYAPKDQCDAVSPCGANGVLPVCSCLRGFAPRSPAAWALRDGHDGCARETPLDCANGTRQASTDAIRQQRVMNEPSL